MRYLRKAEWQDVDLLFAWANEEQVRKNSFSSAPIIYEEHTRWFQELLSRDDAAQYIYLDKDVPVGQVRIAVNGEEAVISYSICVEKRCMGYGKDMLGLLQEQVKKDFPQVRKLVANVKPQNIASQKAFMDMGYGEKNRIYELHLDQAEPYNRDVEICSGGGILYLTNNRNAIGLYEWLRERCQSVLYSCRLKLCQIQKLQPELIVSYNYSYLITEDIIQYMKGNIINLHISFLPWNRGVSPNIWSFIDNTPKGVTIHQVSPEFDTGKILYQRQCFFDSEKETFATVYEKLHQMINALFKEKWDEILSHSYDLSDQAGEGSSHSKKDLQELKIQTGFSWDENIAHFLRRYQKIKETNTE